MPPTVLPAKLTSDPSNPVTASLKWTVNVIGPTVVGSAWPAACSMVTVGRHAVERHSVVGAGRGQMWVPLGPTAAPAGMLATTVPAPVIPVTVTV